MEILVFFRTYNSFGGHRLITPIGGFLEMGMPDFGSAFHRMEVYIAFQTTREPPSSLQSLHETFHQNIRQYSVEKISRKKKYLELRYISRATAEELEAHGSPTDGPDTCLFFRSASIEFVEKLKLIRKKIKTEDDFDISGLLEWCQKKLESLPRNDQELKSLFTQIETHDRQKRAATDNWQKLNIDFTNFHPDARKILDDPLYWDVSNRFTPNGTFLGRHMLEEYRGWRKGHPEGLAVDFFNQQMQVWQLYPGTETYENFPEFVDQAGIGIAFAQIKIEGRCEPQILTIALNSLAEQRLMGLSAKDIWKYKLEFLKLVDRVEKKLLEIQNQLAPKSRRPRTPRSAAEKPGFGTKK